jgi:tRNA 2-thiouridine synthesizing protein A
MDDLHINTELDCRGHKCPMPIIKTRKAIQDLNSGEVLRMVATDPGSIHDIKAWSKRTGNTLLNQQQHTDEFVFIIRKK